MHVIAKGKDHFGHKRTTSEDVFRIHEDLGLYIVCDGSKDPDGLWAAETICQVIHSELRRHQSGLQDYRRTPNRDKRLHLESLLASAVQAASRVIHQVTAIEGTRGPTSSAVDAVLVLGEVMISAHVGNTRLYLERSGKVFRLTKDHTFYEEMVEAAPKGTHVSPAFKKRLTRAIGETENVPVQVRSVSLIAGDTVVICSNGISDAFSDGAPELVNASQEGEHSSLAVRLIENSLQKGVDDNISLITLRVEMDNDIPSHLRPAQRDSRKQLELLQSIAVFRSIRDDEASLMKLQTLLNFRNVAPGDLIIQEGAPSNEMFVLISGKAVVRMDGSIVAERGPNEVVGEMGFFTHELRSATVTATLPCELMSIQRWDFDALIEKEPRLGYRILEGIVIELSEKLKQESQGMANAQIAAPKGTSPDFSSPQLT